ncbi:MAG: peptidylprolyl isomerase [Lachnospiraceae bacterium]|jgi:foldase protein PrsA|nr:peptidylprolyl isomerase [Lachnospiraceae bacterium]
MKKRIGIWWNLAEASRIFLVFLLIFALWGCAGLENTEIILTTGLSGNQLFKVGSSICTLPEAMVYANAYEEQYESVYGVEMWEHDFGGVTLEEYVKDHIIAQLATIKAMTLLAEEYEVTLTEQDQANVEQAAKEYYGSLSQAEREWMNLAEEDVRGLYRDHLLANRVYEEITRDVNTEVSDDEARIITVQQIFLKTTRMGESGEEPLPEEEKQEIYQKALELLEQISQGREFLTLASIYNQDGQITSTFGRGEKEAVYEEAAFALEKEQVSGILETDQGYYILKCTENFDRAATEENKVAMVEKRRDTVFREIYDELIANTPSEFNTRLWETVHFGYLNVERTGKNFFAVYEAYFAS